jgi:hypothetical protein
MAGPPPGHFVRLCPADMDNMIFGATLAQDELRCAST